MLGQLTAQAGQVEVGPSFDPKRGDSGDVRCREARSAHDDGFSAEARAESAAPGRPAFNDVVRGERVDEWVVPICNVDAHHEIESRRIGDVIPRDRRDEDDAGCRGARASGVELIARVLATRRQAQVDDPCSPLNCPVDRRADRLGRSLESFAEYSRREHSRLGRDAQEQVGAQRAMSESIVIIFGPADAKSSSGSTNPAPGPMRASFCVRSHPLSMTATVTPAPVNGRPSPWHQGDARETR